MSMTEPAMNSDRFAKVLMDAMEKTYDYRLVLDPIAVVELYVVLTLCMRRESGKRKPEDYTDTVKDISRQLQSFMQDMGVSEEDIAFVTGTNE